MKKVLTVGVYDMLHIGHIELFRKAKALGDYLIVAVQDSEVVEAFKPNAHLIYSTEERCFMVSALRYVDEVVVYRNVKDIVREVDFDIFAKGPDQRHRGFQEAFAWCEANGKQVVTVPRTEGISSSELKKWVKGLS